MRYAFLNIYNIRWFTIRRTTDRGGWCEHRSPRHAFSYVSKISSNRKVERGYWRLSLAAVAILLVNACAKRETSFYP